MINYSEFSGVDGVDGLGNEDDEVVLNEIDSDGYLSGEYSGEEYEGSDEENNNLVLNGLILGVVGVNYSFPLPEVLINEDFEEVIETLCPIEDNISFNFNAVPEDPVVTLYPYVMFTGNGNCEFDIINDVFYVKIEINFAMSETLLIHESMSMVLDSIHQYAHHIIKVNDAGDGTLEVNYIEYVDSQGTHVQTF